jgi:hypothetical protein
MKHLLTFILLLVSLVSFSQNPIKFKFSDTRVIASTTGGAINRGDQFDVIIQANGNSNSTTRQLMFDLQYDMTNFEIVSVNHTGTGGNGGILPAGSNIQLSWQNYPNYTYAGNSTFTNGTQRYISNATYTYNANGSNAILRATLTWATASAMPFASYDRMLIVRFRLKAASTANVFNPVILNFVAGWNAQGVGDSTFMDSPLSTQINMNQNFGKYVTAKVDLNSNLYNLSSLRVSFRDTVTNQGQLFSVLSDGSVDINQSLLAANKVYDITLMHRIDSTYKIYNSAITISDFTTAQAEFTSMGLDGTKGANLNTGQSLYAADINRNKVIDGGDLPRLLGQVAGLDTLMTIPAGYVAGTNGWMSLPTWRAADVATIGGQVEWAYVTPGTTFSTLRIDMREFPVGTLPNKVKSVQLFDIYTGPVEYVSEDAAWAQYRVPSTLVKAKDGSSVYLNHIRDINNGGVDYALRAEFTFDMNPNSSWGSITISNWNTITYPKTYFKTDVLGTNAFLDLKYLLWGDVNRSHSSQVITSNSGTSTVQTNALNSLQSNTTFMSMATSNSRFINTPYDVTSIDVNLTNMTVTSNNIEIPVEINAKGASVGGLQFQFEYDPTKLKFEELTSTLPNSWFIFANAKDGKVKFGALDQNNRTAITEASTPFKLKFSTIGNGVDILTSVSVSPTMDASAINGNQLGINLNRTQIKLTGYNNF